MRLFAWLTTVAIRRSQKDRAVSCLKLLAFADDQCAACQGQDAQAGIQRNTDVKGLRRDDRLAIARLGRIGVAIVAGGALGENAGAVVIVIHDPNLVHVLQGDGRILQLLQGVGLAILLHILLRAVLGNGDDTPEVTITIVGNCRGKGAVQQRIRLFTVAAFGVAVHLDQFVVFQTQKTRRKLLTSPTRKRQ